MRVRLLVPFKQLTRHFEPLRSYRFGLKSFDRWSRLMNFHFSSSWWPFYTATHGTMGIEMVHISRSERLIRVACLNLLDCSKTFPRHHLPPFNIGMPLATIWHANCHRLACHLPPFGKATSHHLAKPLVWFVSISDKKQLKTLFTLAYNNYNTRHA